MATKKTKKISYSEPLDYFPKSVREKHKLGEYAETDKKKETKKKTVKAPKKKGK